MQELFEPDHPPVLSEKGIIVSKDRVLPLDTVLAYIEAENPLNGPLQYEWWAGGGSFILPKDKDSVLWIAPQTGGSYTLHVKVSNTSASVETQRNIFVSSTSLPLVDISIPEEGSYFSLGQTIRVQATAVHDNGIAWVRLSIHTTETDSVLDTLAYNPNNLYHFAFEPWDALVGEVALRVTAKAANTLNLEGFDHVNIYIEGFISGDHNE